MLRDKGAESGDLWLCGLVSRGMRSRGRCEAWSQYGVSMESVWSVLGSILAATPLPAGRHTLIFMREIRKLKSKDSDAT